MNFKINDKVRHIDGIQIMRVVKYQTQKVKKGLNFLAENPTIYGEELTGYVICSWIDENNKRQEDAYLESELTLVD